MELIVVVNIGSVNKANVGDVYKIDGKDAVCTRITKKYVYIGETPYPKKHFDSLVRDYIYRYNRGKSLYYQLFYSYCPN